MQSLKCRHEKLKIPTNGLSSSPHSAGRAQAYSSFLDLILLTETSAIRTCFLATFKKNYMRF